MPHPFEHRIALLGCPSRPAIAWDATNLNRLRELGFTGIQLNIAWGARPGDEALNLEDVVDTPAELDAYPPNQVIPTRAKAERRAERIGQLRQRASASSQGQKRAWSPRSRSAMASDRRNCSRTPKPWSRSP